MIAAAPTVATLMSSISGRPLTATEPTRRAIHPRQKDQFAVRIRHHHNRSLAAPFEFRDHAIHRTFRLRILNRQFCNHPDHSDITK